MKLAKSANVGIYPETKQPSAFTKVGLRHDEGLLGTLAKYGYDSQAAPVFIQSFEMGNLERLVPIKSYFWIKIGKIRALLRRRMMQVSPSILGPSAMMILVHCFPI